MPMLEVERTRAACFIYYLCPTAVAHETQRLQVTVPQCDTVCDRAVPGRFDFPPNPCPPMNGGHVAARLGLYRDQKTVAVTCMSIGQLQKAFVSLLSSEDYLGKYMIA